MIEYGTYSAMVPMELVNDNSIDIRDFVMNFCELDSMVLCEGPMHLTDTVDLCDHVVVKYPAMQLRDEGATE